MKMVFKVFLLLLCLTLSEAWLFWRRSSKVDCSVTEWSAWSSSNSAGQQTRIRRIMRHPKNGGKPCPPLSETRDSVDCTVTVWSSWGANFGFGQQSRLRTIITRPIGTGKQCPVLEEIRHTGKVPSIKITAKNFQDYFMRPDLHSIQKSNHQIQIPALPRDLVLIMDSSGSIGKDGFQEAKQQTSKLIGLLCPNSPFDKIVGHPYQYNQAAMLTYSSNVVENFNFKTYNTTVNIQNAIRFARYEGKVTSTHLAFDQARTLFTPYKGVRNAAFAKREVLILTDGRSTNQQKTIEAVEKLKLEADVYGLMIGKFSTAGANELTQYVSSPKNEHLFYLENYEKLKTLVEFIEETKRNYGPHFCAPFNR